MLGGFRNREVRSLKIYAAGDNYVPEFDVVRRGTHPFPNSRNPPTPAPPASEHAAPPSPPPPPPRAPPPSFFPPSPPPPPPTPSRPPRTVGLQFAGRAARGLREL